MFQLLVISRGFFFQLRNIHLYTEYDTHMVQKSLFIIIILYIWQKENFDRDFNGGESSVLF